MFNLRLVNLNWLYLYISNPVHGNLLHVSSIIRNFALEVYQSLED